jgi:hypothetical protein
MDQKCSIERGIVEIEPILDSAPLAFITFISQHPSTAIGPLVAPSLSVKELLDWTHLDRSVRMFHTAKHWEVESSSSFIVVRLCHSNSHN